MIGFCELGVLLQKNNISDCKKTYAVVIPALVLIGVMLSNINGFAEVRIYSYGQYPILFVLTSLLFGGACVLMAMIFQRSHLLGLIGRNTLVILLLHKFPVVFFQSVCPVLKNILSNPCGFKGTVIALITSVAVIGICYIVGLIIEKIFPVILGKTR